MKVGPITEPDIDEVGRFLHEHMNRRIAPEVWSASLRHRWARSAPNFGMQLHAADGRLVGVLLAVYSDQWIDGRTERFCNPHSWCVLDDYRHASINLVLAVLRQRDYHFTMFTPNPKVAQVFMGLRFRLLDATLYHFPNLRRPWPAGGFTEGRREHIAERLSGAALEEFEAHRDIPWLHFVAFGRPGDACLAIYKRGRWKKMPCALLGHLSDPGALRRHADLLRGHLLAQGLLVSRIEGRFVDAPPPWALRGVRTQPKLVATRTLPDSKIRDVYSELMALDI